MNVAATDLVALYKKNSKHSAYQILPRSLENLIEDEVEQGIPRFEAERFEWLKSKLDFTDKRVADIGGNTGYFTFEAFDAGAREVVYVEGNTDHAQFVAMAAEMLHANVKVIPKYFDFSEDLKGEHLDIVLLFNVIHHLGDDFGDQSLTKFQALEKMKTSINYFADKTDRLVLQMGYCWKGDRKQLLFANGTKAEMTDFVKDAIQDIWEIEHIGVAEEIQGQTVFADMVGSNMGRNDKLGEFRNRPIFILKKSSK
jgi:SAM-dependent methyltransferase